MTNEIPAALEAYHPGVVHHCRTCGSAVVDAVETPGEAFQCLACSSAGPTTEDDLTRAALADPGTQDAPDTRPSVWRLVVVIAFAVVALGIVFFNR